MAPDTSGWDGGVGDGLGGEVIGEVGAAGRGGGQGFDEGSARELGIG